MRLTDQREQANALIPPKDSEKLTDVTRGVTFDIMRNDSTAHEKHLRML